MSSCETHTNPLVLLGAGPETLSIEAKELANQTGHDVLAYIDEDSDMQGNELHGLPIMGIQEAAGEFADYAQALCTIDSTQREGFVLRVRKAGFEFTNLIDSSAQITNTTDIGRGTWIHPGTVIAGQTDIGKHVLVNRGCLIGHDVEIQSFAVLGPGVNIGGCSIIGSHAYIGMGATIRDGTPVGEGALIGAGAVVVKEVPARTKVLGVPARVVEDDIDRK